MEKRKVLHIIQTLSAGGCEYMILRLIPHLEKNNWQSIIVTLGEEGELAPLFHAANIKIIALKQQRFFTLRTFSLLSRHIREIQPNIITTYLLRADILGRIVLPFLTSIPVISYLVTTYNHPKYRMVRFFEWATQLFTSHYLANSEAVKTFFEDAVRIRKGKIIVVPTGVDISIFQSAVPDKSIKRELGLPEDAFVITCVGSFDENKGQTYLLDAFEKTFLHIPLVFLLLIGRDGTQKNVLIQQRDTLLTKERIFILGTRSDIPNILYETNLFVLPTLFEGMSLALLEAMAARKTIITTDIPENKVILSDHKTALLVPPKDRKKLASALEEAFKNPEQSALLRKAAFEYVKDHYSLEASSKKLSETYSHLCQK